MAKFYPSGGSGGGVSSDELTGTLGDVLAGATVVARDTNDEIGTGTLQLTGNATAADVLAGKTFYGTDAKVKRTGTKVNRGAPSQALNCGQTFTIPAGSYDGGSVTANNLASQTGGATAYNERVYQNHTYWRDGVKYTGTMTVNSILSFKAAAYSTNQILFTWQNPYAASGKPFTGVYIQYSTTGYGQNVVALYGGVGNNTTPGGMSSAIITMPEVGRGYYFQISAFASYPFGNMHSNFLYAYAATTAHGQVIIQNSQTWTVPAGVRSIDAFVVGGGASGAISLQNAFRGSGGGGGFTATKLGHPVTPGQQIYVEIGVGGTDGIAQNNDGSLNGKTTTVNGVVSASGAIYYLKTAPAYSNCFHGMDGGSGGGGSSISSDRQRAGNGGADGGNGGGGYGEDSDDSWSRYTNGGTGQGRTTRAFAESGHALYAGGGGGAAISSDTTHNTKYGLGGAGGGGTGANCHKLKYRQATPGGYGTGGGGGGLSTTSINDSWHGNNAGGSGTAFIRW